MAYSIVPVWRNVTPELQAELVDFWIGHKAMADAERAKLRAQQAVCVLRDADGALCGVATAFVQVRPRLRQPMYYFRQFIAPEHRRQQQAIPIFKAACEILEAANRASPECLGVLMEIENPDLARIFSHVVGARTGAVFLGYSPRGHQLRAVYFQGAKLFQPAPLRRRQAAPGLAKTPEQAPTA
ncbi:hypothetical protein [Noviluteimonas gilva]|uniref:GNAT family N-acetyltransferase n=1 Tax=Noviluteimonas gilva TaxID=2682097 RepID=A0A7C9M2D6_9GAMM|nr:hypothetical protein [Lysobacter gilvus]MUV13706.1 hypothetical protein [Lysobacter gilvus]